MARAESAPPPWELGLNSNQTIIQSKGPNLLGQSEDQAAETEMPKAPQPRKQEETLQEHHKTHPGIPSSTPEYPQRHPDEETSSCSERCDQVYNQY